MKKFLTSIFVAIAIAFSSQAFAINTFDENTGVLTVDKVTVAGISYDNVVVTISAYTLLGVDSGTDSGVTAFDQGSNTLTLSNVTLRGTIYTNVRVLVQRYAIESVGKPAPTIKGTLTELNRLRASAGVNPMVMNDLVTKAAQNHADYIAANKPESHTEDPSKSGFTGVAVKDRLQAVGYSSYASGEELPGSGPNYITNPYNPSNDPVFAIQSLFMGPYHGLGLLGGYHDFGMAKNGVTFVVNFASRSSAEHSLVRPGEVSVWPCNNVTNILNKSVIAETPTPIAGRDIGTNPIGTPTYVLVTFGNKLLLSSYEIRGPQGAVTIAKVLGQDASDALGSNQMAILPDKPLALGTTYTSTVTGTNNGVLFSKTCQFTTVNS